MESLVCSFYVSVAACKNCLNRSVPEIHSHVAATTRPQADLLVNNNNNNDSNNNNNNFISVVPFHVKHAQLR